MRTMVGRETTATPSVVDQPNFPATHWSVVLAAAEERSVSSAVALEKLCRTYWYPLYAYVRRRGYRAEDAQDLTQEFFSELLARHGLATVSPAKGKFRSFLLACMNHVLAHEQDRANRKKRGGGQLSFSLDARAAEERYRLEPVDELTPEKLFEQRWAAALLEEALNRLDEEYAKAGKAEVFAVLQPFLTGEGAGRDYPTAAETLDLSEGAVRVATHRLRRRFGATFCEVVAETLDNAGELDVEVQHLLGVLSD